MRYKLHKDKLFHSAIYNPIKHMVLMSDANDSKKWLDDLAVHCFKNPTDELAFRQICYYMHNLILNQIITKYYHIAGNNDEDIYQISLLEINHAIQKFKLGKMSFFSFAKLFINSRLITELNNSKKVLKNLVLNESVSYDVKQFNGEDEDETYLDNLENAINERDAIDTEEEYSIIFEDTYNTLYNALTKNQRRVLQYYVQGKTYGEIAELLGMRTKQVDNYLKGIKITAKHLKNRTGIKVGKILSKDIRLPLLKYNKINKGN